MFIQADYSPGDSGKGKGPVKHSLEISHFKSSKQVGKRFSLDRSGNIATEASVPLCQGTVKRVKFDSLIDFGHFLETLSSSEALSYGLPVDCETATIFTKEDFEQCSRPQGAITRTRDNFAFPVGRGIMMLDVDECIDKDTLIETLSKVAPCLNDAPMLWRPSSSSGLIVLGESHGLKGQRLYIDVADASLIPDAGRALVDLLWAHGHGSIKLSSNAHVLERTLIDGAVFQPERLDFVGPPTLADGISREKVSSELIRDGEPFNLNLLLKMVDGTVQRSANDARTLARRQFQPTLEKARDEWIESALQKYDTATHDTIKPQLLKAHQNRELMPDFVIQLATGPTVTVAELLNRPTFYDGKRCADPLEPTYRGDQRIAIIDFRPGLAPSIYSHAHGGIVYSLVPNKPELLIEKGYRPETTDQALDILRADGQMFDQTHSNRLVQCSQEGELVEVSSLKLTDRLERRFSIMRRTKDRKTGQYVESPSDCPDWLPSRILGAERQLPELDGTITAPILRLDGSILDEPGYDPSSKLLYVPPPGVTLRVPPEPLMQACKAALGRLMAPFARFPFVGPLDRSVNLAAFLTIVERSALPKVPGFVVTAPTPGSGKTLLVESLSEASGTKVDALSKASEDDECATLLFSALQSGQRIILWDNYGNGARVGNEALYIFLTSPTYTRRVFNQQKNLTLPNRSVWFCTGNNLSVKTDAARRLATIRLDAKMDKPQSRVFDFRPDQLVAANRLTLTVDALTLIRGYLHHTGGARIGQGDTGSFEDWDRLVRQTICWIATWDSNYTDIAETFDIAADDDEDSIHLGCLLEAAFVLFQNPVKEDETREWLVSDLTARTDSQSMDNDLRNEFKETIENIAGDITKPNNKKTGHFIRRNLGRRIQKSDKFNSYVYHVECSGGDSRKKYRVIRELVSNVGSPTFH